MYLIENLEQYFHIILQTCPLCEEYYQIYVLNLILYFSIIHYSIYVNL